MALKEKKMAWKICTDPEFVPDDLIACSSSDWLLSLSTSQSLIIIPHLHVSHPIGYSLSTLQNLIIMPGPGSVFAKNFTAYVHIGCLSNLMHGGQQ